MLQMMSDNEQAPEIERLDRHEFNLDTDQRQKLVLEGEEKIKQVCSFRLFCMHLISVSTNALRIVRSMGGQRYLLD